MSLRGPSSQDSNAESGLNANKYCGIGIKCIGIDNLTDKQFSDMLEEFNAKADSLKDLFSSLNSRISNLYDEPTGPAITPHIPDSTTTPGPVYSINALVKAFKQKRLEALGLGYVLPMLAEQEVI